MICSKCGNTIESGDRFCPSCGFPVNEINEFERNQKRRSSESRTYLSPKKPTQKKRKMLVSVCIILLLITGIGIVLGFTLKKNKVWDGSIAEKFAGGSGSENNPYRIKTAAQFALLAEEVRGGNDFSGDYFKLTADIYLNDIQNWKDWGEEPPDNVWTTIGERNSIFNDVGSYSFSGTFDGNGHKVFGIYLNSLEHRNSEAMGLFGYNEGIIMNLGIEASYMNVKSQSGGGGIVGYNNGTITNCFNTGTVIGSWGVGGIIGVNADEGIITDCYNIGTISGSNGVGGLVGCNYSANTVSDCYNLGCISGDDGVGGILGSSSAWIEITIMNCYNTGNIIGEEEVGGIQGENWGLVSNCFNSGNITGVETIGGITGINRHEIHNCYNTGCIEGQENFGGITGINDSCDSWRTHIVSCYNVGKIVGFGGGISARGYLGTSSDCYFLDTSCVIYNSSDIALTDEQMRDRKSYENFDFAKVWTMKGSSDYSYPELKGCNHVSNTD